MQSTPFVIKDSVVEEEKRRLLGARLIQTWKVNVEDMKELFGEEGTKVLSNRRHVILRRSKDLCS